MARDLIAVGMVMLLVGCSSDVTPSTQAPAPDGPNLAGDAATRAPTDVDEDCSAYDPYLAALGELTADCMGTVDPGLYEVGDDGAVRAKFQRCSQDTSRYTPIRQLLSLQQRGERLPRLKACFADRFRAARQLVDVSEIESCPSWRLERRLSEIDASTVDRVTSALPELPSDGARTVDAETLQLLDRQSLYRVEPAARSSREPDGHAQGALQAQPREQLRESLGEQAKICAAAFPGFVLEVRGDQLRTDPTAWLSDAVYSSSTDDPYLRPGYYHPMCYFGPPPGALYGAFERYQPCGPLVSCSPEICCYYAGSNIKTYLQKDCLDDSDITTCVSYCGPKLP